MENSIIKAMAANGHTTTADVVAILRERITELEEENTTLRSRLIAAQIRNVNARLQLRRWAAAWKQAAKLNRAALRNAALIFAASLVERDNEIDRLTKQRYHYATQMGRWWKKYRSQNKRRGGRQ